MKKLVFLLCLISLIPSYAVSDNQVVYVYRNDGNMDAFYENELDSVRYSKLSVDSILYTNFVTQEFYTKRGVTRIPLEAIDSISTYQPETILKSDVFTLTDNRAKDVVLINGLDITFSKSASELPTVGQVLVSRIDGQELEKPFAGRVKSIENTSNGVLCHCSPVGIDDIFDQITFFGRASADDNASANNRSNRIEASFNGNIYEFDKEVLLDTLNGAHSEWTLKEKQHMEANFEVLLHKEWGEPLMMKFKYSYEHSVTEVLSFSGESVVFKKSFNIYNKTLPRIWFAAIPFVWFTPRFNVDLEVSAEGYIRAAGSMEVLDKKTHELVYSDGTWTHKETADNSENYQLDELAIGGKLEASLCPKLNIGIYESEYGLGIGGSFGMRLEGGYKYDADKEDKMRWYSVLQDVQESLSFPMSTNIHARHDFDFDDDEEDVNEDKETEMEDHVIKEYEYELPGFTWYLLPTFHHVYLLDFPENNQYQASMKIERDLLMPVYVGYLLEREIESASRGDGTITSITPIWGEDDPEKLLDDVQTIHWFGRYWSEDDVLHYGMMRKVGYNQPGKGTLHPIVRFPWMKEDEFLICPQSFTTPFNGKQLYSDDGSGGGWVVH